MIWPRILHHGIEICFAHKDFKWTNNAKYNAAVIVVIIGLGNKNPDRKQIFYNNVVNNVTCISPYLVQGETTYILSRSRQISNMPEMKFGNMPADNG